MIILCDVDNVLADDGWRVSFIRWSHADVDARFHEYHVASSLDSTANLHLLDVPQAYIVLLTAMSEEYESIRTQWLIRNAVPHHRVLYRPRGDRRSAVEVKRAMITQLRDELNLSRCIAAYDDRQDIVDMFLSEGLPGVRVAIREHPEALQRTQQQESV